MIHTKLFEIRDKATFIPAIGTLCRLEDSASAQENYLMARAGYGNDGCILFTRLDGGHAHYDVYGGWNSRTMQVAHDYITTHWDELESGAVIDVEFILGETTRPKASEAIA